MYKIICFFRRKEGLTREEFLDYYEHRHVPLILSLAPSPPLYRRNYTTTEHFPEDGFRFDVMTEIGFPDKAAYEAWEEQVSTEAVHRDELAFFDPSSVTPLRIYGVEARTTEVTE